MKTPKPLRWLLVLWLAFAPASHAYLYVSDNPWTKIDPNGLTERAEGPNSAGDFVDGNGYIHILSGQAPGDIGGPQAKALEVVLNRNHPANEKRAQQNFQNSVPNGSPLAGIWSGHYLNDAGDEVKNQPRIDWLTVGYLGLMEALGKQGPATPTTTTPGQAAIDDAEEVNNANKANTNPAPSASAKAQANPPSPDISPAPSDPKVKLIDPDQVIPIIDDDGKTIGYTRYGHLPVGALITSKGVPASTMKVQGGGFSGAVKPSGKDVAPLLPATLPPVSNSTNLLPGQTGQTSPTTSSAPPQSTSPPSR